MPQGTTLDGGLILCAQQDQAVARYSLDGLPNKVMAGEYKLALPDEAVLIAELEKTQRELEHRGIAVEPESKKSIKKAAGSKKRTSKKTKT